jgi:predicted dehydrogenase
MDDTGLRVAVVGGGRHAQNTIYPAMISAGYDIQAVATNHLRTAESAARRFGGRRSFDSVENMLSDVCRDIEGIVVILPADSYEQTLINCLPAGLPIYCEKPVALDSAALHRI